MKKYRHTYSFSDFFYTCFVTNVKRYRYALIYSLQNALTWANEGTSSSRSTGKWKEQYEQYYQKKKWQRVIPCGTKTDLWSHMWIFFFPFIFCSLVLLGEIRFRNFQISKQTETLLFPLHAHTWTPQTRKRGRGTKFREIYALTFFLCALSLTLSVVLCVLWD